ncbi:MAG: ABC transporter ATP-binding protein [Actinomycetota bacterium]|nr:ABC transporter ATP-binding protein [Actinomycetota bacterium]
MSFLELRGLQKTYADGTQAVRGVDLSVDEGELIVLLGPSGCGKTTTLRMVAGLELATEGSIHLRGDDVTLLRPSQRDVGMVFQFYALYPHLTVRENIAFPLRAAGVAPSEIRGRVEAVAERMDLGELLSFYPRQLSGGDQQKVSLARAIVRRPAVYLMDEPLGTLDADQRLAMRELIRGEQQASKVTTIYVTHDQEEAMSLADRVVVMAGGRIRQVGTPGTVYDRPADLFVASFVGSPKMNLLDGELTGETFTLPTGFTLSVTQNVSRGAVTLGVRPDDLIPTASDDGDAAVTLIELLGPRAIVTIDARGTALTSVVETSRMSGITEGARVALSARPGAAHVFDAQTGRRIVGDETHPERRH